MRGPQRICYVIPSLDLGGTERQLLYLLSVLSKRHEIEVICTNRAGAMAKEARRYAKVHQLGGWGGWDYRMGARTTRILRSFRPDVLHSFMFGFDYRINVAARKAGIPVIVSSRRQLATWKNPRHIRLQRKANELVDCVVANSQAAAGFAIDQEEANPDLFRVIPNGIDVDKFQSAPNAVEAVGGLDISSDRPVVGMVANFSPVKDHDLFLEMASELILRSRDVRFLLAGDGPTREHVERSIIERNLENRVILLTGVSNIERLYKQLSVSVLTSRAEGCPNVVLETMASGTPFVGAAVGGIPELIEQGVTGRLVDSRRPSDFADAVEEALDCREESAAMAMKAVDTVRKRYSIDAMAEAYEALYEELLYPAALGQTG